MPTWQQNNWTEIEIHTRDPPWPSFHNADDTRYASCPNLYKNAFKLPGVPGAFNNDVISLMACVPPRTLKINDNNNDNNNNDCDDINNFNIINTTNNNQTVINKISHERG